MSGKKSTKRKLDEVTVENEEKIHHPNKKRRIEIDVESDTNLTIPKEIMLDIFSYLSPKDKLLVGETCKYWLECSIVSYAGWICIGEDEIAMQYLRFKWDGNPRNGHDVPLASYYEICDSLVPFSFHIVKSKWTAGKNDPFTPYTMQVEVPSDKIKLNEFEIYLSDKGISVPKYSRPYVAQILADMLRNSTEETFSSKLNSNQWKIEVFPIKDRYWNGKSFSIKYYFNVAELEQAVENNTLEYEKVLMKHAVEKEVNEYMKKENKKFMEIKKTLMPFIPPRIDAPKGLKEGFKFHRYQLDAISWMNSIENDVDKEFKYCDLVPWRRSRMNVLVDLHSQKFVLPSDSSEYIGSIKSTGGVLADDIGLGKTLELIGLSLHTLKNGLPMFGENGLYNTNAALVVCPNHIAQQWVDEVKKYTNLNVVLISTLDNINTTTYGDIISAAIVVVTSALFKNKNYFALGCGNKKVPVSLIGIGKRKKIIGEYLEEVKNGDKEKTIGPVLDHFNFRRIIVDEAHEVLQDPFLCACINAIPREFSWYVSATPFPSLWVENDLIYNNLIWRNTKESIADEYSVPDYEEELILVDFHPIETLLHKYSNHEECMKLCSGEFHAGTLDSTRASTIAALEMRKETIENQIKSCHRYARSYLTTQLQEFHRELQITIEKLAEWPRCETVLMGKNIMDPKELEELDLVNNSGSKMAKLVSWLRDTIKEDDDNRFILFSQFSGYLNKIRKVLRQSNIASVQIEGNVVQKTQKLKQFKEENIKVLLMCLGNSAAGTNLIEANYVVLVDPMQGSIEEARAYEIQAVGRAHRQGQEQKVRLVRFVVRDSVEQELYLRNKSSGRASNEYSGLSPKKAMLARSSSLASSQLLQRTGSAATLLH